MSDLPVELVEIDSLVPHPDNPREGDVGAVYHSIEENGWWGTVVVQRSTRRILAGRHRTIAAAQAGHKTVPVYWIDCDDDRARRILLADNRTNDVASYDQQKLADLLTEIANDTGNLDGTGYIADDLDQILSDLQGFDHTGEPPAPPEDDKGYSEQYGVIVVCADEQEQEQVYEALAERYAHVKVVVT